MGAISWILAVVLLLGSTEGKPQIGGDAPVGPTAADPSSLVSPWSQWMSLKAPPIPGLPMGGSKAKKKLVPGPPPPEGVPEAPWVSWTRMKVSSALSPPAPLAPSPPPPPPPSPVSTSNDTSPPESAVWIQWTQMKLPLTNPLTPPGSTPETPWDAWTKLKLAQIAPPSPPLPPAAPSPPVTDQTPGLVRRMAPDRYLLASTMSPRILEWPSSTSSQQNGQSQPSAASSFIRIPAQVGQPSSARPGYLDILNVTPSRYIPSSSGGNSAVSRQTLQTSPTLSQSQVTPISIEQDALTTALRPIPHQLVSEIVAKATPEELTEVILAVSKAEEEQESSPDAITVQQVLPSTLIAKISDDLTPLLGTSLSIPATLLSSAAKTSGPISIIPEPARTAIVSKATPEELDEVVTTLAKLEAVPPSDQAPIANLPVSLVIPPTLQAKLPPSAASTKLVPPVLLNLPSPVVNAILSVATPPEIAVVVANVAKLEKVPSLMPRPPLGDLLPPSLVAKLPSQIAPLLDKPVPSAATASVGAALSALPTPLAQEILEKASPEEAKTVVDALSVVEAAIPLSGIPSSPPAALIVPSSLIAKLSPQLSPLLAQPLTLAPPPPKPNALTTLLEALPSPVIQQILVAASPEELEEISENVKVASPPVTTPISPLIPATLTAKLPPQVIPYLNKLITILPTPAAPPSPSPPPPTTPPAVSGVEPSKKVATALSKLPPSIISNILTEGTPTEISDLAEIVDQLAALPLAEKSLISQVKVGDILPPTLAAKLPATDLPLLSTTPVVILEDVPVVPGVKPEVIATIAPVLSALPPPVVEGILKVASPVELAQIEDTITKLEAIPPTSLPLISQLEVKTILPDSLIAKLPKSVISLLAAPVTITVPPVDGVPPKYVETIKALLSMVPPPVVAEIVAAATPAELVELAEIVAKLEALPPAEAPLAAKLDVGTILPATLVAKLPPAILPLLSVPITIPPAIPPTAISPAIPPVVGVLPETVEAIVATLAKVPTPVISEILNVATPTEIAEIAETVAKLEALTPAEAPLVAAELEVESILPASLVAKLPPAVVPLLSVPITIPPVPQPVLIPPVTGIPPKAVDAIVATLSKVPPPVVAEILKAGTPAELAELVETVTKMGGLPPAESLIAAKLEVGTILPPTLVAKLPPSVLPLLNVPVTIPPPTVQSLLPQVAGVPPKTVETIVTVLSKVPPAIVSEILSVATPIELEQVAETISKLEKLPPAQKPLVTELEVESILPATLVAKLPPSALPLLEVPLTIPAAVPPTAVSPAIPPVVGVPPKTVEDIATALSKVPSPVVTEILQAATPAELAELAETVAKLETLLPAEALLASKLEVDTILPASLLAKLPPSVVPLLSVPVTIPSEIPPAAAPLPIIPPPAGVPPKEAEAIATLLSNVPPPIVSEILAVASPEEIEKITETIEKLEAIPPAEALLAAKLEVDTILPASLIAKLPPSILPLLDVPVTVPEPVLSVPGVPPAIVSTIVPALSAVPPEVLSTVLSLATPVELTELADTISKLEALPPAEKPLISKIDIETVLPATLVAKLPPAVLPLLAKPLTLPESVPAPVPSEPFVPPPSPPPAEPLPPPPMKPTTPLIIPGLPPSIASIAVPALSELPPPVIEKILTTATPSELAQVVDTLLKLEALTPEEKLLASVLEVGTILPPTLVGKLPPPIVSLLAAPIKIPGVGPPPPKIPAVIPAPQVAPPAPIVPGVPPTVTSAILPALSALPTPIINSILTTAAPSELAQLADIISELEALPPSELSVLSSVPVKSIIPPPLLARLPPSIVPVLAATPIEVVSIPTTSTPPGAVPPSPLLTLGSTEPIPPAEKKVLVKWAKIILDKTGKPATTPIPGEMPPLQAAWMEWVQLKTNATKPSTASPVTSGEESTTEYPWTKWLKLKSNTTALIPAVTPAQPIASVPLLDVTTEGPEKTVLEWLEELNKGTEAPPVVPPTATPAPVAVSPETEEMVVAALKDLGIEIVDLPPEQVKAILEQVEKTITAETIPAPGVAPPLPPAGIPPSPTSPELVPQAYPPAYLPYLSYSPPKPFPPYWPPQPAYFLPSYIPPPPVPSPLPPTPESPLPPTPESPLPPALESPLPPTPTLNLTEYLISNSLIPPETAPTAPIPIPTLTKLITEQALTAPNVSTPESVITASELSSLTPTKFAALLKQILQDCRVNATSPTNSSLVVSTRSAYPNPYASYYKKKYASMRGKRSPALYPIPSQAFTPTTSPPSSPLDVSSLPLPKVDTSGTVLDPAYWAAQKSMFLSKLFSTLAQVALNDTNNQATTMSPKDVIAQHVNSVLLGDMTRSVHHHPPKKQPQQVVQEEEEQNSNEEEDEYEEEEEEETNPPQNNQGGSHDLNQNEKELVSNDNSEPNLPKEPENPLHKLFKFGVQKTVLSDLSTTPAPIYIYVTPPPYYPVSMATPSSFPQYSSKNWSQYQNKKKSKGGKKKKNKRPSSSSSHHSTQSHHHNSNTNSKSSAYSNRFRASTTTTENPVDFELLAKALLLDDTTGNGPKTRGTSAAATTAD